MGLKVVPANLLSDEWFRKLAHFARLLDRVKDVEGDAVECGVAEGKTFAIIASLVRSSGQDRCVWGFDSWDDPSARSADDGSGDRTIVLRGATIEEVRLRLRQMGFDDLSGIMLVKGDLAETLANAPERIALAHLNVQFDEPYRICFENLWPRVESGGIVALGGNKLVTTKAVEEFVSKIPRKDARIESDPAWQHRRFIVKS